MSSVFIVLNKWCPSGAEVDATDVSVVCGTEQRALDWLSDLAEHVPGSELKANGYVLEVPMRGTDFNTYYIEERDVE